jgi:hypothetical protein
MNQTEHRVVKGSRGPQPGISSGAPVTERYNTAALLVVHTGVALLERYDAEPTALACVDLEVGSWNSVDRGALVRSRRVSGNIHRRRSTSERGAVQPVNEPDSP